jgi:hypothetical protein
MTLISSHKLTKETVKDFFFAGKAIVTLRNSNTGNRFTYKITKSKGNNPVYFINVFTGTENTNKFHYTFIGTVFQQKDFKYSPKSQMPANAKPITIITLFFNFLHNNTLPKDVEVWHEGKCGCCGRSLTVPESLLSGIGPECNKKRWRQAQKQLNFTLANN